MSVIFERFEVSDAWNNLCEIALKTMQTGVIDDESTLVQVMD